MPNKQLPNKTKKNLLDLEYNKYLQYYNTSIILLFTFIIGLFIGFVTKQIDYKNPKQLLLVAPLSIGFIVTNIIFIRQFKEHLTRIPKEIQKLKL